jgi:hypothetical protein
VADKLQSSGHGFREAVKFYLPKVGENSIFYVWLMSTFLKFLKLYTGTVMNFLRSVVDPDLDPVWIRIQEGNNDPQKKKKVHFMFGSAGVLFWGWRLLL